MIKKVQKGLELNEKKNVAYLVASAKRYSLCVTKCYEVR